MSIDFSPCERFILEKMSETKIPGLSIAVVKDNEVVYARGFGFKDLDTGTAVSPRTLFGIGSVTKSFTALAIMMLAEEDKLDVNDSIEKWVPLKIRPFGEEIRIHHLLTHSSGIPALAYAEAFISNVLGLDHYWLPVASPEDIISFMADADKWVHAKPGERFFYLNEGYVLLGYIISKVSGVRYETFIKERILKPLRMERSYFAKDEVKRDGDFATPYIIDKEGKHIKSRFPFGVTADGGLISNVLDLANYIMMYLNRGEFNGNVLVKRESIELMEQIYIRYPYALFEGEGYGYGWSIVPNFYGHKLVNHSGSVGVHTAYVGYIPGKKVGVAVLANAAGYPLRFIGMYILAYLLGENPEELPMIKNERILKKLEGIYETYKGTFRVEIKKAGDYLIMIEKNKYQEFSTPLVPEKLSEDLALFYVISAGRKIPAEFIIKKDRIEFIYERYKFIKRQ